MLLLAVHIVQEASAKVPLPIITLLEAIKNGKLPSELKCRQVVPTSGTRSTSLWDATSRGALLEWLDEYLDAECNSEVFEVQEELSHGISAELTRARATEKVTENTRATAQAVGQKTRDAAADVQSKVGELDSKLKVSEHAAAALKSARETQLAKKTSEVLSGVGRQAQSFHNKALENQRIAQMNANISAGWTSLSSTLGGFVKGKAPASKPLGDYPEATYNQPALQRTATPLKTPELGRNGAKDGTLGSNKPPEQTSSPGSAFTLDDFEQDEPSKGKGGP